MRSRLLPALALALFGGAIALAILTAGTSDDTGIARSASSYDDGPGGTSVLRRYLEANGLRTTSLQSDRFAIPDGVGTVLLLGATEPITTADIAALRAHVRAGGVLVIASDLGLGERELLEAFGVRRAGAPVRPGEHEVASIALASPVARRMFVDVGIALDPGPAGIALVADRGGAVVAQVREGLGTVYAVGTLAPFLNGSIGSGDNGRLALALAGAAPAKAVAFDEYHHGLRAGPDALAVLTGSWPGRSLLLVGALVLAYLVLSGRRLGPPLPLDPRPPRSSLEFVRSFAGLVRRSGRREIPRGRLRDELRSGLAAQCGLDPATPAEQVFDTLARRDPARASRARSLHVALGGPARDEQLLRIVAEVQDLVLERR